MSAALHTLDLAELRKRLSEALSARHSILTLKTPSYIQHSGVARSYSMGNLSELDSYIADLTAAISAKEAGETPMSARRPIHVGVGL